MKIDQIYKKIIVNTLSQFGSKTVSILLSLFSVGLLTRYLDRDGYGNYTLVFTYLSFFGLIADVGFNTTLVREFSRDKNISQYLKATFLTIKLVLVVLSVILPVSAVLLFPYSSFLKNAIIIGALAVAVGNLMSYATSVLQSELRLGLVAVVDLITKFVTVLFTVYFIHIHANFYYIIGAILIGNVVGLITSFYYIRDYLTFNIYIDRKILQKFYKIALPIGITSVLSLLYFKIDTILLSIIKTPADVGTYGLAYNILENVLMLWGLFMASVFPLLSRFHGQRNASQYRDLLRKTLVILVTMSIVIIFFGNVFDYLIMRILGGSKFFSSMQPFKILLLSVPFFFLNNVFYNVIVTFGKTKHLISPLVFALVVNVALNLCAIPRYGYIGASYATVITELCTSLFYIVVFIRNLKEEAALYVIG